MTLTSPPASSVSLYDARPFFEKALQHGVQRGIIDAEKLALIGADAPKGMVQIARFFGTEFLRPELEKARERMVNLISLYLEHSTGGDLDRAAESLRDHSFLSRSKGGSDMLKALIAMPESSSFEAPLPAGNELAEWSLRSLADYQAELARRTSAQQKIEAAFWLAEHLGMDPAELDGDSNPEAKDADAVIRTALLVLAAGRDEMPDWPAFDKLVTALRKKFGAPKSPARTKTAGKAATASNDDGAAKVPPAIKLSLPQTMPTAFRADVQDLWSTVLADLPKILDSAASPRALFAHMSDVQTPPLLGRYFWIEDTLGEVAHVEQAVSRSWDKVTGGHSDEGSLVTLFLCVAAGVAPKTLLTEKSALALVRKLQKTGLQPELARAYIAQYAPAHYQDDYAALWDNFVEEAQATLESDATLATEDALALLRREGHVR